MNLPYDQNLISVVTPCYNAAPYVEEAIRSVLKQSHAHTEIIVVDDGSQDGSIEIVQRIAEEHPGRIRLLFQNRMGPFPARNQGLKHARGSYVAFLDADDWWREDCLEKLLAAIRENDVDLAYCGWQNIGAGAPGTEPYVPPAYESGDMAAEFLRTCPWPIHAALVRREAIDAVHGFSERCFSAMDYDLWLRLLAHTQSILRVPEVMAFYRWHGKSQISANKWRQVMDAFRVRRDFVQRHPDMVRHLPKERLVQLTDGFLLREAYRSYWRRELHAAQRLFRRAFRTTAWKAGDLKYLLPSLLPGSLFRLLVGVSDRLRTGREA